MKMSGNTVLITGGTSGIGFEMAKQFLKLGNKVLITGRDAGKIDKAMASLGDVAAFRSDVSHVNSIPALYAEITQKFPDLNILINNAGIMRTINLRDPQGGFEDVGDEIEINLNGPIRMVKQFLPHLKSRKYAAIMNVTSGLAFIPLPICPIYCAAKAGLHSYTESLRIQLKGTRVGVFELVPPATATDILGHFNSKDMEGVKPMPVTDMVRVGLEGMAKDQFEIRPGQANMLKIMSRLAPGMILKQMSKPVDGLLARSTQS